MHARRPFVAALVAAVALLVVAGPWSSSADAAGLYLGDTGAPTYPHYFLVWFRNEYVANQWPGWVLVIAGWINNSNQGGSLIGPGDNYPSAETMDPTHWGGYIHCSGGGNGPMWGTQGTPFTSFVWHQYGMSWDGTSTAVYFDGAPVAGGATGCLPVVLAGGQFRVGGHGTAITAVFNDTVGSYSHVRYSSVARNAAWFLQEYNAGRRSEALQLP